MKIDMKVAAVAGVAGVVLLVLLLKKKEGESLAMTAGAAVGGAAVDAASGVVLGIGEALGVTRTSETECEKAMREGRSWDASFACDASTFLSYMTGNYQPPVRDTTGFQDPYVNHYDM